MQSKKIDVIFNNLSKSNNNPKTELKYKNAFTFLISVVLSAQATDKSVNAATSKLFVSIKTPEAMVKLGEKRLKSFIKSIGLYNSKAKNIISLSDILIKEHNSKIPRSFKELTSLPGVGNKTASVYQNEILNIPRIAVDTHVFRVSNRIGLVSTINPDDTQLRLESIVPKKWLKKAHLLLILHGRYVCKSQKPDCKHCNLTKLCTFYKDRIKKNNFLN